MHKETVKDMGNWAAENFVQVIDDVIVRRI